MCNRIFRCLVCLCLVAVLLFNLSPLRAEATSVATGVAVVVAAGVAVAVGLQALGIRQGSDAAAFNTLVSECSSALSPEWAIDGLITMLALSTDGITKTYASQGFLQSILDFLFDSGTVTATEDYVFPLGDRVLENYAEMMAYPYHCVGYNKTNGEWYICGSNGEFVFRYDESTGGYFISSSSSWYYHRVQPTGWVTYDATYMSSSSGVGTFSKIFETGLITDISTSSDLTLESVGHDLDTDYETYVDEGIVSIDFGIQFEDDPNTDRNEEDDNNTPWIPAAIPSLNTDNFVDQTQADAQSGVTSAEIVEQLLSSSGSGSDTGSGDNTGSDSWLPPSDHMQFALGDLSKFFPFCIPFDLFDFFQLLNADPVAPVFSWEIQDLSGQIYSLTIDLAEWEPVAQLFRRLQLFLFICGLAAASRKYIKW